MKYEEMITGLAEEMLEKIACEAEEVEVEETEVEMTEEEIEQLAAEMFEEELCKLAKETEEVEKAEMTEEEVEEVLAEMTEEEIEQLAAEIEAEEMQKEAGVVSRLMGSKGKLEGLQKAYYGATKGLNVAKGEANNAMAKHYASKRKAVRNAINAEKKAVRNTRIGAGVAAAGAGAGAMALNKKRVQEKAASYFEEAEFLKQAAEEAYNEALMMQDAAIRLFNNMEE